MLLAVDKISRVFNDFEMNDVSFNVQKGQYFVLLGASGTGKSVLLEIIAGLVRPDAGQIFLNGINITDAKIQKRNISLVFQDSTLFPHMTVYDNIAYPLRYTTGKSQIPKRVDKLAEDLGVMNLLRRKPQTLSGGESQRISLARAIASKPECLLLDEPLSSLDARSRPRMRALLRKINAEGQTIIHVTHDYTEAVSLGTHIAVMEKGTIVQAGTAEDIFQHPKSEFVARFIGVRNFFKGQLKEPVHHAGLKKFQAGGLAFSVLTDRPAGAGFVCIRSEDVTILNTSAASEQTSARNNFSGTIVDIVRNGLGLEVIVDIGINTKRAFNSNNFEIAALISSESAQLFDLNRGKKVYISFKASAVKYVEE